MKPIGTLPPRRDEVTASHQEDVLREEVTKSLERGSSVVQPKARDRLLDLIHREQIPEDVRETLAGAMQGDLHRQHLLFQAMMDTWPRLQTKIEEVARAVSKASWSVEPHRDGDQTQAEFVESAFEEMRPDPAKGQEGWRGMIHELARGYYIGHVVNEVIWHRNEAGELVPVASKAISSRYYGYPSGYDDDKPDELMFSQSGGVEWEDMKSFPKHHFLVGVRKGHPGHPSVAAPLRALAPWWLASVFGLKWLLQFAQLYGVPFRKAIYANETDKHNVCDMLNNIGSSGWGAFPKGTELEFVQANANAQSLPQTALIEMADKQCDIFILGQSLTSDVGSSGSRALGDVHSSVRDQVLEGVADFVGDILNYQLVPSLMKLNYGASDKLPKFSAKFQRAENENDKANRDKTLIEMGAKIPVDYFNRRHNIPKAKDGEAVIGGENFNASSPEDQAETLSKKKQKQGDDEESKDAIVYQILADLTGASKKDLEEVKPFFIELLESAEDAERGDVSEEAFDEKFAETFTKAQNLLPEFFDDVNSDTLLKALQKAMEEALEAESASHQL